jgi:uncharacterized membrane protein YhhN
VPDTLLDVRVWLPALIIAALLGGIGLVSAEQHRWRYGALKTAASLTFVVAGVARLPWDRPSSWALCAGLVLSLAGDVLLVEKGKKLAFLAGLAAFLCAHAAYGLAFALHGLTLQATLNGGVLMAALGAPLSRWLMPKVSGAMRGPVVAYIVTITAMVTLAAGAVGAGAPQTLLVGAVCFYLSDVGVARERFVTKDRWNGLLGLPLYYAAQLLLVDGLSR